MDANSSKVSGSKTKPDSETNSETEQAQEKTGILQVVGSVLAAGFGVQSSKNRKRDFQHGKYTTYIIAGMVFTLIFVVSLVMVVRAVIENAGG